MDIDCDCVYRDIGPLDSIIQVAGRCNRNKRFEVANMYVLNLIEEDGGSFTKIYGPDLIEITKEVLSKDKVNEKEFLELIENYFQKTKGKSQIEKNLITSLHELYFYGEDFDSNKRTPISKFKLIEEETYKVDVFVEADDKAKEIIQKYNNIRNNDKLKGFEKKNEFLKIKKEFYDYVISVDREKVKSLPYLIEDQMVYILNKNLEDWYKQDVGFDPSPDASFNSRCL